MADPTAAPQQVYDKVYARVVEVDPGDPVVAANPQRFEPVADQHTYMLTPDGQPVTVPASQAEEAATKAGYQFLDPEAARKQVATNYFLRQHDDGFRVGAENFANSLLLGVPNVIEEHTTTPEYQEAKRIAGERHQIAGGAGTLAGALAGGFIGGGIAGGGSALAQGARAGQAATAAAAEQAAPGFLARLGAATARTALEGMAWSSPEAVAHAAYGDVDRAAETLLWGLGTGGLLGFGAGSFAEAKRAGQAVVGKLAGAAERGGLVSEGRLDWKKLGISTPEEATRLHTEASNALAEHAAILDREIGKAPAKVASGLGVKPGDLAEKVQSRLLETAPGLKLPGFKDEAKVALTDAVQTIASKGDAPMTFEGLANLRRELTSAGVGDSSRMRILRQVDAIVEGEQSRAMAQAVNKLKLDPSTYAGYLSTLSKLQQAQAQATGLMAPSAAAQWLGQKAGKGVADAIAAPIGGAIGNAIGGPVGGWLGFKAVQPVLEKTIGHLVANKATDVAGRALTSIARNEGLSQWFGAALTKQVVGAAEQRIASVPRALMGAAAGARNLDSIKAFLGQRANGLTKEQQFQRVSQALTDARANVDGTGQEIAAATSTLGHDPALAQAVAQKQLAALGYLHNALPKPPPPQPFRPAPPWQPSPAEKAAFSRKLEVVQDPFAVVHHVAEGTLTKEHVDALRALYPTLHEAMVAEVAKMASDPKAKLSYGSKAALQLLTGVPLTSRPGDNWQQAYQPKGNKHPAQGPAGPPAQKKRGTAKLEGPELETPTQRLANR